MGREREWYGEEAEATMRRDASIFLFVKCNRYESVNAYSKEEESPEIVERMLVALMSCKWSQMGHLVEKGTSWSNTLTKVVLSGDTCHK